MLFKSSMLAGLPYKQRIMKLMIMSFGLYGALFASTKTKYGEQIEKYKKYLYMTVVADLAFLLVTMYMHTPPSKMALPPPNLDIPEFDNDIGNKEFVKNDAIAIRDVNKDMNDVFIKEDDISFPIYQSKTQNDNDSINIPIYQSKSGSV